MSNDQKHVSQNLNISKTTFPYDIQLPLLKTKQAY